MTIWSVSLYEEVCSALLKEVIMRGRSLETGFNRWDGPPYNIAEPALKSLYNHLMTRRIKSESHKYTKQRMASIVERVVHRGDSVITIAQANAFSMYKLAKLVLEHAYGIRLSITKVLANPNIIPDARVRADILNCIHSDPINSPTVEAFDKS